MLFGLPQWNSLTAQTIRAAFAVHSELGPGLLESVYEEALAFELSDREIEFGRQVKVPVLYRGRQIGDPFRLDLMIGGALIVEVKAVETIHPIHRAQLITYLKLTGCPVGLLINFNVLHLKEGIERVMADRIPKLTQTESLSD